MAEPAIPLSELRAKLARDLERARRWERIRTVLLALMSALFAAVGALAVLRGSREPLAWVCLLSFGAGAVVLAIASFPNNVFERRNARLLAARTPRLEVDHDAIVYREPGGETRRIEWRSLAKVDIVTTDGGPFDDDVFWVLTGGDTSIVASNALSGIGALAERVSALPGVRSDQIAMAMSCTHNAHFAVWQAPGAY